VAWTRSDATGAEEHRIDGATVRVLTTVGGGIDIHELVLLASGNYLLTSERTITGPGSCGQPEGPIADNGVQEIAPDGSLVWSWWASDHIPMSEVGSAWCNARIGQAYDSYHINSAEPDGSGFVLSFRHLDALYKIDKASGNILWKLGGVPRPESLTVVGDSVPATDQFRGQHDARVVSDGSVTVHDNGFHPTEQRPARAVRYAIDTSARTATLIEQKNDPGTVPTPLCCGSARKLPGGDWLISWGSTGVITELSPSGGRVFSLTFDDGLFSYRARPVLSGRLSRTALRNGMDAQFPGVGVHPKGAPRVRVPLVPAFKPCTTPDRTHGPPLGFPSCGAPAAASSFLTVGTRDANGASANATGFVAYKVLGGNSSTTSNEADVTVRVLLSDVRRKADLADYTGQLQVRGAARVTDRLNGTLEDEAGTLDAQFPVTVPCAATASATVGASCTLASTFNAIVPGTVIEGKRANWELGKVQIFDGGSSGTAGASDATLFETEGLFFP
jgi:hypothetical protein